MPTYNPCPPSSQEYCFNGGECFYLSEDPSVYICSCFMPFYGPQCEHEAPKLGVTSTFTTTTTHGDSDLAVRRSVDRAMTITALVFIVVTFIGLVLLAWYLSRRRRKDYTQWKRINQQSTTDQKQSCKTMDKGVQVFFKDLNHQTLPANHSNRPSICEPMESSELRATPPRSPSDSFGPVRIESADEPTRDQERRGRSLQEVFREIDQHSQDRNSIVESVGSLEEQVDEEDDFAKLEQYSEATKNRSVQDRVDSAHEFPTKYDNRVAFEENPPVQSKQKTSSPIKDAQLQAAMNDLAEMDHEQNEPDASMESPNKASQSAKSKQAAEKDRSNNPHPASTSELPAVKRSPITVDRATRQALNEQYKLGLKRISPSVQPRPDETDRRYHTLTHVGRSSVSRPVPDSVHTTYVNAIDVTDLLAYRRIPHVLGGRDGYPEEHSSPALCPFTPPIDELILSRTPCRTHTLPRATVSPLWIETHPPDGRPTPIQEPFTVASQHDALLSELYNRGSVEPLVPTDQNSV